MTQKKNDDDDNNDESQTKEKKGGLLKELGDIFNTPLPELLKHQKKSADDDDQADSFLEKLGDLLNTPLPELIRPKDHQDPPKEKAPISPAPQPKETDGTWEIGPVDRGDKGDHGHPPQKQDQQPISLQTLKRKQTQEWEAMKRRHQAEEQALKLQHEQQLRQAR